MNKQQLSEILVEHAKYLTGNIGKLANLQDADLQRADLRDADLRDADLRGAYLQGAYLQGANLQGANLRGANLRGAYLQGAYLQRSNLRGANLRGADLQGAYLQGADLQGADLQRADLQGAYLRGAYLPHFQIVPEAGAFVGFKKLDNGVICMVEIPAEAKRTSSLVGRKCRAEFVKVLEGNGKSLTADNPIEYAVGKITRADSFDDDIRVECTNGIHFFITRQEAEEYI